MKTLTIPKWLNDIAEKNNVNFSQVLQSALKEYLGLTFNETGIKFEPEKQGEYVYESETKRNGDKFEPVNRRKNLTKSVFLRLSLLYNRLK